VALLGLATETLLAATDRSPPELREFALFPTVIGTSTSSQAIAVTLRAVDDLNGIAQPTAEGSAGGRISVQFQSSSRNQSVGVWFDWRHRVSGDELDGVYVRAIPLPRLSEPGVWTIAGVELHDALGNPSFSDLAQFATRGFPWRFTVANLPSLVMLQLGGSVLASWPAWATEFWLQSAASLGQAPAWSDVTTTPVILGQEFLVALPVAGERQFFRLRAK